MKIWTKSKGEISLSQKNYVTEGGEGKIFAHSNLGFKIYHDQKDAISENKISELSVLKHPNIIAPEEPIKTKKRGQWVHIGHTFRFVKNTWSLCQLFPKVFRERENLSLSQSLDLVRKIQAGVDFIHDTNTLLVDMNEMNFLVSKDFSEPYFIDVDSYQTPSYPATALMLSYRDWSIQNNAWTKNSDWFSFAILSFQTFIGIHPFKGKHPSIKGLEKRMKANISVLDKTVRLPKARYPLSVIPTNYQNWYRALFEDGKRCPPPKDLLDQIVITPIIQFLRGSGNIKYQELFSMPNKIRSIFRKSRLTITQAGDKVYNNQRLVLEDQKKILFVGVTNKKETPIGVSRDGKAYNLTTGDSIPLNIHVDEIMVSHNRIYARTEDKLYLLDFVELTNKITCGFTLIANVLANSSKLFSGVLFQNMLGEPYVSVLPDIKDIRQLQIPELKGHKIIEAKFEKGVLVVILSKKGEYHRWVFRFSFDYTRYSIDQTNNILFTGLNFIVLETGVCVLVSSEEKLELFSSKMGSSSKKIIEDDLISSDIILFTNGNKPGFYRETKAFTMSLS